MTFLLIIVVLLIVLFFTAMTFAATIFPAYATVAQAVFWVTTVFYLISVLKRGGSA